jgi:putative addiction module CopG family antidote
MRISLSSPDWVEFIEEQVTQGRFTSPAAVVEAALQLLKHEETSEGLDTATLDLIRRSRDEFARARDRDFKRALGELRKKL